MPWEGLHHEHTNSTPGRAHLCDRPHCHRCGGHCTASVSVNQAAAGGHGDKSSQVQAKKEYKQGSTHDVVMAKKEYKQLITPSAPGE